MSDVVSISFGLVFLAHVGVLRIPASMRERRVRLASRPEVRSVLSLPASPSAQAVRPASVPFSTSSCHMPGIPDTLALD